MKTAIWILLFFMFSTSGSRADVAEEYERYVNKIVPGSKEIAKRDAFMRELALFVDRSSLAQSHLTRASEAAYLSVLFGSRMKLGEKDFCPTTEEGLVDVRATISEIFLVSQVTHYAKQLALNLESAKQLRDAFKLPCGPIENFASYDVSALEIPVYQPDDVNVVDGIYVVYATNASASSGDGKDGFAALPLIGSAYQIGANLFQNKKLGDLQERIADEFVKNKQYQTFAKKSCEEISTNYGEITLKEHARISKSLAPLLKLIDLPAFGKRRKALEQCVDKYAEELVQKFKRDAVAIAQKSIETQAKQLESDKFSIRAHDRINLAVLKLNLKETECRDALPLAHKIKSQLSALTLYLSSNPDERKYVQQKKIIVKRKLSECAGVQK